MQKKKAKKIEKEQRTKRKQTPKGQEIENEARLRVEEQKKVKAERDRELNKKKQEEQERKAVKAQIKQLVLLNEIKRSDESEETFQFAVDKKIKKIYVNKEQFELLAKGRIAIASLGDEYYLVPGVVADKINQRDIENTIVYRFDGAVSESVEEDEDPYKDFVVPDDLKW